MSSAYSGFEAEPYRQSLLVGRKFTDYDRAMRVKQVRAHAPHTTRHLSCTTLPKRSISFSFTASIQHPKGEKKVSPPKVVSQRSLRNHRADRTLTLTLPGKGRRRRRRRKSSSPSKSGGGGGGADQKL
jgi:hypothetical protein